MHLCVLAQAILMHLGVILVDHCRGKIVKKRRIAVGQEVEEAVFVDGSSIIAFHCFPLRAASEVRYGRWSGMDALDLMLISSNFPSQVLTVL